VSRFKIKVTVKIPATCHATCWSRLRHD